MPELPTPKNSYLVLLLLTIITLHCYWNSLSGDFLSDDVILVTKNYDIRSLQQIPALFARSNFGAGYNDNVYRPLIHVSLALNYYFGGLNTFGYHLFNLIVHLLNGLLVYRLTLHYTEGRDIAFLNAIFFLAHPVRTEAVTWVSGRSELLSAFFFLTCWTAFIEMKRGRYIATAALFLLALFSKESTAILPAVILMTEFYKSYKWNGIKRWLSERIASYAVFLLPLLIYILTRLAVLGSLTIPNVSLFFKDMSVQTRLCTMAAGVVHYFKLLVWPATLCFDYDFSVIPRQDSVTVDVVIYASMIFGILLLGVILVRIQPIISYAILFFFLTIFIVSNILVPVGILISERVLYIPAISIGLILAKLLSTLHRKQKALQVVGILLTCAIVIPASVRCVERNKDWQNAKSYGDAYVRDTPGNVKGRFVRAAVFESEGRLQEAEQEYRLAVMLSPNLTHTHSALGAFLYRQKRYQEALNSIQRALELSNRNVEAFVVMGKLLNLRGDHQSALEYLLKAAELSPDNIPLYNTLATTLQLLGRHHEAIKYLQRILELEPDTVEAHLNLATSLQATNQDPTEHIMKAIRLDPSYGPARYHYGSLLLKRGDAQKALQEFLMAMNRGVDAPELHNNLGVIYAQQGQIDKAKSEFNTALRMRPSYEAARQNLEKLQAP